MSNAGWSEPLLFPRDPKRTYKRVISTSHEDTKKYGYELGKQLKPNSIVCFFGDLGAGKTTFIKGLASAVSGCHPDEVNSPTYVYLNIYEGHGIVYHFDLYRLRDVDEFLAMGFDEYLFAGGVCCLEWSEKIKPILPDTCVGVVLKNIENHSREISIYF
jgi:tRNA threonylcarbamoyladenosine biosynthesis protein TsaE